MQENTDGNKNLDIRKTIKVPLVNVLKNSEEVNEDRLLTYIEKQFYSKKCDRNCPIEIPVNFEETIQETIFRVNTIVTNVCNFVNAFVIYEYNLQTIPAKINLPFLLAVAKRVTKRENKAGRKGDLSNYETKINTFYEIHFKNVITNDNIVYDDKLSQILQYEMKEIIKNIEVNIKEHYIQYVYRCINIYFKLDEKRKALKNIENNNDRKIESKKMYDELNLLKQDLLQPMFNFVRPVFKSKNSHHNWLIDMRKKIVPKKKFKKNSIFYDVQCDPQDYLANMISINRLIMYSQNEKDKYKLFHIIPLRTSFIPSHITLDTSCLISILNDKGGNSELFSNINKNKHKIWETYFKVNSKNFKKKGYKFTYMIKTDGVSCCVLFAREDRINKKGEVIDYTKSEINEVCKKKDKIENEYIESVKNVAKVLKGKTIVCGDPNYGDLGHFGKIVKNENEQNKLIKFRYTRNQRRLETKAKKYKNIREEILEKKIELNKNSEIYEEYKKIYGFVPKEITVSDLQNLMSFFSSKRCVLNEFLKYVKCRNLVDVVVRDIYRQEIFRKLRFNSYTNTQKSESKMVNNFKEKMGDPKTTIVICGDYDDNGKAIKGKEPIISKRIRKVLRNGGYKCYLINEYNTSALCNICEHKTEGYLERISKKPKYKGKEKIEEVWGLRRCSNLNCKVITKKGEVRRVYNRDDNAVMNMIKIVNNLIKHNKRPINYCREIEKD